MPDHPHVTLPIEEGLLARAATFLDKGVLLNLFRYDLDMAVRTAAADPTREGLLRLARLTLLRERVDQLAFWLPDEVLQVMAVAGRFDDARAYAYLAGDHLSSWSGIARALYTHGLREQAHEVVESVCERCGGVYLGWHELARLLAWVDWEPEARWLAEQHFDYLTAEGESWDSWGQAARWLADVGIWDLAHDAAEKAVADFITSGIRSDGEADDFGLDLQELTDSLRGLLGPAARTAGLERLVEAACRVQDESGRLTVLARLARELCEYGESRRAAEVLDMACALLADGYLVSWIIDDSIEALVQTAVRLRDRDRLRSLLAYVHAHSDFPDGVTGAALVDVAEGLLATGSVDAALETLREGVRAVAADELFLRYLTAEWLQKAALLMVGTGLPGSLEEALEIVRLAPSRDCNHAGARKDALGALAGFLLGAERIHEALAVASEAVRCTWEYVSIVPELELLRNAAQSLVAVGSGGEGTEEAHQMAAEMAGRALETPDEEVDPWARLLTQAELERLRGDEVQAAALVDKVLAEVRVTPADDHFRRQWVIRVARLCGPLRRLRRAEAADRLAWEALELTKTLNRDDHPDLPWSNLLGVFREAGDVLGQDAVLTAVLSVERCPTDETWRLHSELLLAQLALNAAESGDETDYYALRARIGDLEEESHRSGDVASLLARGLVALGKVAEAVELLRWCLDRAHSEGEVGWRDLALLARVLISAGMLEEALELPARPLSASSVSGLAVVFAEVGWREEAERALRSALVRAKEESEIFSVLRDVFAVLAQWEEADTIVSLVDAVMEVARLQPVLAAPREPSVALGQLCLW